ncbi:NAD(P)/FAD-dependent oxidoreductase [[Mycoplasma] testudinis]|uniref:NAD(P)/FAD-dependent oxidoreductase n=1 Tax=[Mycoplasma] testudinis TaxID=33924 RepID=UPI000483A0DA|nr:NAD(P)/FAD-dependent oxidoreductase [[Mycoplasma] testudinis]
MFDILIIGAGPAGIYAATYAALKKLKILVIEASNEIGGQPAHLYAHKKVHDFPGHLSITGLELVKNLIKQQEELSDVIEYQLNTSLVSYQKQEDGSFSVELSTQKTIQTKTIIIATGNGGFGPVELDLKLLDDTNGKPKISYSVNEFKSYEKQNVVMLGGGDSAVEWASQIAQSKYPKTVTIIHRKPSFRANSHYVETLNDQPNVTQIMDSEVLKIDAHKILLKNNQTQVEQSVPYDSLLVQYGLKPLTNRASEWTNLKKIGASILVDKKQETSEPNIYAIGLSANYPERTNLMVVGMAEATIAVKSINQKINPYGGVDYVEKKHK